MSRIKREIVGSMAGLTGDGSTLSARFRFPGEFVGFQGHFPGKKILPGVCQVQCVLSMLEEHAKRPVILREIVLTKFFTPVLPDEEISCVCRDVQNSTVDFTVSARISRGGDKVSELKLRLCYAS